MNRVLGLWVYLKLPKPTFLFLIINPNMEFIGTLQKSRFWWVKVGFRTLSLGFRALGKDSGVWGLGLGICFCFSRGSAAGSRSSAISPKP